MRSFLVVKMFVPRIIVLKSGLKKLWNRRTIGCSIYYTGRSFLQIINIDRLILLILMTRIVKSTWFPYLIRKLPYNFSP